MSSNRIKRSEFSEWILRPQTLIALSAVLLSVCGLFISIYEASLVREAQRASVWPYIEVSASISDDSAAIWVRNTGVGPARIRAAAVTLDGDVKANWSEMIRVIVGSESDSANVYQSLISGRVLPAGSVRETIFSVNKDGGSVALESTGLMGRAIFQGLLDVSVCYCSVYNECWISRLQDIIKRSQGGAINNESNSTDTCESAARSRI